MSFVPNQQPEQTSLQTLNVAPQPNNVIVPKRPPNVDLFGAIRRRKFIVLFFLIVGLVAGYFYNKQQQTIYLSSVQLMVWAKTPPQIVGDEVIEPNVSISKHSNLVSGEDVLKRASELIQYEVDGLEEKVEEGKLIVVPSGRKKIDPLPSLVNSNNHTAALKRMVKAKGNGTDDDTLSVTCSGIHKGDLPIILKHVVVAYQDVLEQNSKTYQESKELLESFRKELEEDIKNLRVDKKMLLSELGVIETGGVFESTDAPRIAQLEQELLAKETAQNEILERRNQLEDAVVSGNEDKFRVAVLEARGYLALMTSPKNDGSPNHNTSDLERFRVFIEKLKDRRRIADDQLKTLILEQSKLSQHGLGHPKVKELNRQTSFWNGKIAEIDAEIASFQKRMDETLADDGIKVDWAKIHRQEEEKILSMYHVKLQNDFGRLNSAWTKTRLKLAPLKAKAKAQAKDFAHLNDLSRQIQEKSQSHELTVERLKNLERTKNYDVFDVQVLNSPSEGQKVSPVLTKTLAMFGVIAAMIGFGLALLIDRSELAFRAPDEIAERMNLSVIGQIPKIDTNYKKRVRHAPDADSNVASNLSALLIPNSVESEAFRAIRTQLFFAANSTDTKVIMITSPSPNDGKSTVACNLAGSIAQTGKKVVLVDGDFRRPRVHQYFDEEMNPGIIDMMEGSNTFEDIVRPSFQENLYLVTCGGRPKNPGEIVTSDAFRDMIDALRDDFDFVIIDSPPSLPVADPIVMSSVADGVYIVLRIRKGVIATASKAKESLDRVHANILGIIVNGMDQNPHYNEYGGQYSASYSYSSGYGRYQESSESPRRITQVTSRSD